MAQDSSIKIRVLPRAGDKAQAANVANVSGKADAKASSRPDRRRMFILAGSIACFALAAALIIFDKPATSGKSAGKMAGKVIGKSDSSSYSDPSKAAVSKHLNDVLLREKMMARQAEVASVTARRNAMNTSEPSAIAIPDRSFGVHLDQEDSGAKIYQDLNYKQNGGYSDSVEDQINSRLANRKWLNELDKAERINYIRNFLRSAYEQGYEVQLDQNLVVVGVRRINQYQKVNIDSVINKMAAQGN